MNFLWLFVAFSDFLSDLKAENVLVAKDLSMRLMDFGLSKLVDFTAAANNMTAAIGEYSFYCHSDLFWVY